MERKLTKWDDYLIHQTADPIEHMAGTEYGWVDWVVFVMAPPLGVEGPMLCAIVACYPNTKTMQSSALTSIDGIQYNFRAAREIFYDRADTVVGPISFTVDEPLKKWTVELKPNPIVPVSFNLKFTGRSEPFLLNKPVEGPAEAGLAAMRWGHAGQPMLVNGTYKVKDVTYTLENWVCLRARSWGVRAMQVGRMQLWLWFVAHFKDCAIWIYYEEGPEDKIVVMDGAIMKDNGETIAITKFEHNSKYEKDTRYLLQAQFTFQDANGKSHKLSAKKMNSIGINGRATWGKGEGWWEYKGPISLEGEQWDFNDPKFRATMGATMKQDHYEYDLDGERGVGFIEYAISKRNKKYGSML